jgi:hypothetical protein
VVGLSGAQFEVKKFDGRPFSLSMRALRFKIWKCTTNRVQPFALSPALQHIYSTLHLGLDFVSFPEGQGRIRDLSHCGRRWAQILRHTLYIVGGGGAIPWVKIRGVTRK